MFPSVGTGSVGARCTCTSTVRSTESSGQSAVAPGSSTMGRQSSIATWQSAGTTRTCPSAYFGSAARMTAPSPRFASPARRANLQRPPPGLHFAIPMAPLARGSHPQLPHRASPTAPPSRPRHAAPTAPPARGPPLLHSQRPCRASPSASPARMCHSLRSSTPSPLCRPAGWPSRQAATCGAASLPFPRHGRARALGRLP
mmetsp:Transcript_0/g.2  ORF Transcript_0/g.2 Transcript_0/m.2 type:complete len:200 (+) Transcript_0:818-1417(+)